MNAIYPDQVMSPQLLRNYFARFRQIQITDKEEGNTVTDLARSRHLHQVDCPIDV